MKNKLLFQKATEMESLSITTASILLTTHVAHTLSFIHLCVFFKFIHILLRAYYWLGTVPGAWDIMGGEEHKINKKINMQEN